jgi:hypothetical protein
MPTVDDVMEEARGVYLNDPSGNKYTEDVLFPHVKNAYSFLQSELRSNGLQVTEKYAVESITAGTTSFTLPSDIVIPVKMEERLDGSSDEYDPMHFVYRIKRVTPGNNIKEWSWRENAIQLREATGDREVRLTYKNSFPVIIDGVDDVYGKAEQYLAAKASALALMFIDQATDLANIANEIAERELREVVGTAVKLKQAAPVRRKPYLPFRSR